MALRDGPDGRPEFEVDELPVIQLSILELTLDDGPVTVQIWQDDDEFALCTERRAVDFSGESSGIFRATDLVGLPCELVSRVDVRLNDRGNVSELLLAFEHGAQVLLVAGESEEEVDGRLRFRRNDESVLLFRNPADATRLDWLP